MPAAPIIALGLTAAGTAYSVIQQKKVAKQQSQAVQSLSTSTAGQATVTETSAREAAKLEAEKIKNKKGFRSTILTGPLGDLNQPSIAKATLG